MVNFLFYKQDTKKKTDRNGFLFRQKKKEPIPQFDCKDRNKRAKNMKFTLIFFKASAVYLTFSPTEHWELISLILAKKLMQGAV